jgi:hypothetical protein
MSKYSRCTYQAVAKIIADEFCWARDSFGVQQQRMFDEDFSEDSYLLRWRDKLWRESLDENPQVREEYTQKQIEMGILHEQLNPREDGDY